MLPRCAPQFKTGVAVLVGSRGSIDIPRVETRDTIVIGAGLSGLAAARRPDAAGQDVLVLEARERVGGRALTSRDGPFPIDLGGQWIGPTQERVLALVRELGIQTFPQWLAGERLLEIDGRLVRYRGTMPKLPLFDTLQAGLALARLEVASRLVSRRRPWLGWRAADRDRLSVAAWAAEAIKSPTARKLLTLGTEMIFAASPKDLSFQWFLFYLRSGGGFVRLAEVRNGAQQDRFLNGAQDLAEALAARVGGRVLLGAPVSTVTQASDRVTVTSGMGTFYARRVILALAPAMAHAIVFAPDLPPEKKALHAGMPMGSVIKVVVGYATPFWRDAGLSGEVLSDLGPCRGFFDDTSADGNHAALVGFIMADDARRLRDATPDARRAAVVEQLVRIFGAAAGAPTAFFEKDWTHDPWSGGCYTGLMPPGLLGHVRESLRTPVGRLHFAGTETATRWAGYFDGAIEAGERAADEVLRAGA